MLERMHVAKDVSITGNKKCPSHWDVLELSLHTIPSPSFLSVFISLFMFSCLSPSLTHSRSTVQLWLESLSYAVQGPQWGSSLGSWTKQRRWCYQNAARRLSARIGPGWPRGQMADACWCQAPSASPPWTSAECGKAVEFVCGCILILHLFGSSHAWPSKPAALLALLVLIALAWLAVCFWLHSLISIPQEATTTVAAFRQGHTHTQKYTYVHGQAWMHICVNTTFLSCTAWNSRHSLNWFLGLTAFFSFSNTT